MSAPAGPGPPHRRPAAVLALALAGVLAAGCASAPPYDYRAYVDHMPTSILVLPPLDQTPEVEACYGWLATATQPLAERGYYVFPVALVDRIMRENGLPTSGEMHQVSLARLNEIFDPDAVLYVTVRDWGTSYQVINSSTTVTVEARLVDADTGTVLWAGSRSAAQSSGGNSLLEMAVGAVVNQVVTELADPVQGVARQANQLLFLDGRRGLLVGPYHPGFEEDQRARAEALAASAP